MSDKLQSLIVSSKGIDSHDKLKSLPDIKTGSLRQKLQSMRAVVGEITDNNYCARQNDRRVHAHKTDLHVTNRLPKVDHRPPQTMNQTVNNAEIKYLPQPFARNYQDRLDYRRFINFINVVFVFQQARHLPERLVLEHK